MKNEREQAIKNNILKLRASKEKYEKELQNLKLEQEFKIEEFLKFCSRNSTSNEIAQRQYEDIKTKYKKQLDLLNAERQKIIQELEIKEKEMNERHKKEIEEQNTKQKIEMDKLNAERDWAYKRAEYKSDVNNRQYQNDLYKLNEEKIENKKSMKTN